MEALRQLWRVLGIIFQGIYSLWNKYWSYRTQKAEQRRLNQVQAEPKLSNESQDSESPHLAEHPPQPETLVDSVTPTPPTRPKQQIEIQLTQDQKSDETASEPGQWYAPGQGIQIQDIFIADGLIYAGNSAPDSEHQLLPLALINPKLSIQKVSLEKRQAIFEQERGTENVLSYEALSPEMRGIFLGWLATGRKEREVPASILLLFLYGIEYRVIELLTGERTLDELLALILELERLEVHYAHHQTIQPNIQGLIECCQVQLALSCQPETLLALLPIGQKLSMALKVALGRCIETAKPIPMTLLWAWYQSSAIAVDLKTPAKRCDSSFNFLIQTRGEERGFSIVAGENPAMLPVVYHSFNPTVSDESPPFSIVNTVDIAGLEPQLACLEPLIEECTNDLDAYSRLIGRSPEAEGTPIAVALLPQELVLLSGNDEVQTFQQWLNNQITSHDWAMVAGSELLQHWPTAAPDKIKKKEAELLGQLMAKLGFGYVPDVRYGQGTFNPSHSVGLFRLNVPGVEEISGQYPIARIMMEMMPFVDRSTPEDEVQPTIQTITTHFALTPGERSRLATLEQWRTERPLTWKQTLNRIKKLSTAQQEQLAIALNTELQDLWTLETSRHLELQSVIPLTKLDIIEPDPLESTEVENSEVALTAETELESTETEIEVTNAQDSQASQENEGEAEITTDEPPEEEEPAPPTFVLDTKLIAQRNQESQVASGLLSDIFTEEEAQASLPVEDNAPPSETATDTTLALGLDQFHWHLLNHLGQKESWERSELEAIAQNQGLLLDGALENINDAAFDHCDEALTEGDDPIEVNDWVFDELKAA